MVSLALDTRAASPLEVTYLIPPIIIMMTAMTPAMKLIIFMASAKMLLAISLALASQLVLLLVRAMPAQASFLASVSLIRALAGAGTTALKAITRNSPATPAATNFLICVIIDSIIPLPIQMSQLTGQK